MYQQFSYMFGIVNQPCYTYANRIQTSDARTCIQVNKSKLIMHMPAILDKGTTTHHRPSRNHALTAPDHFGPTATDQPASAV